MKKILDSILSIFSGLQVLFYLLIIAFLTGIYLYLTTNNTLISIMIGLLGSVVGFFYGIFLPKKLEREQFLLKELHKYATTMTFYLQSGYNVLQSLKASQKKLDREIQTDIQFTIDSLLDNAELKTSHFDKYKFPAIDIFHQVLRIKYEIGGDVKELFKRVNESINFEIVKRDELFRRKKYMRNRILTMMAMVLSMPLILLFMSKDIYVQFLEMGMFANILTIFLVLLLFISLLFLQRATTDISIIE